MAEDKIDLPFFTEISDPVPAVHTLHTDDQIIEIRSDQAEQVFRVSRTGLVEQRVASLIENADI